jgi:hypothetical protein
LEYEKRKQRNLIEKEVDREIKINNFLLNDVEREEKIQKALLEKKNLNDQLKR